MFKIIAFQIAILSSLFIVGCDKDEEENSDPAGAEAGSTAGSMAGAEAGSTAGSTALKISQLINQPPGLSIE